MTTQKDIKWGPAIAVDGKRPEFVREDDIFQAGGSGFDWYGNISNGTPHIWNQSPNREPNWSAVDRVRLPADHPHYRQTEAAIPEGMKPWHGGDAAPADWDGKEVRVRNGTMVDPKGARDAFTWQHTTRDDTRRMPEFDIVAYTPEAAPIDWSGELEAVHEDGRTIAMKVAQLSAGAYGRNDHWLATADGSRFPSGPGSTHSEWAHKDGDLPNAPGWRIRNVPQPTPQADTKPDLTARDDMEKLVRDLAASDTRGCFAVRARAIVALLPEPVDPLEEAKTALDVFLSAYDACADHALVNRAHDDDLLTYGHLRTILHALAGEKEA